MYNTPATQLNRLPCESVRFCIYVKNACSILHTFTGYCKLSRVSGVVRFLVRQLLLTHFFVF